MENLSGSNTDNTNNDDANDITLVPNTPIEGENQDNQESQEEAEPSIVLSVLDDLGLTEEYSDLYDFDDDIDLDTPTGIKQVVANTFIAGGEMFLKQNIQSNPELYSLYLHFQNGGTLSSFQSLETSLPALSEVENNVDLQIQLYRDFLTKQGHEKDEIDVLVGNAVKNESIKSKALKFLAKEEDSRQEFNNRTQQEIEQKETLRREVVTTAIGIVKNLIVENEFSAGIKLNTESKKEEFYQSFKDSLIYEDGNVFYNQPLTDENIKDLLEQHFLLTHKEVKNKFYANKSTIAKQEVNLRLKNKPKEEKVVISKPDPNEGKISALSFIERI